MSELITKGQAIKQIQKYGVGCFDADDFIPEQAERFVINKIKELQPIQPKTGHWIYKKRMIGSGVKYYTGEDENGEIHMVKVVDRSYADVGYCSECGKRQGDTSDRYCSYCGSYNGDVLEELSTVEPVSRWIPVTERLPEPGKEYLMTVKEFAWANTPISYRVVQRFFGGTVDFVAWMPLPEPYESRESEEE